MGRRREETLPIVDDLVTVLSKLETFRFGAARLPNPEKEGFL